MSMKGLCLAIALLVVGFVMGVAFEYSAHKATIDDIQEAAMESCALRIKTLKHTFR